MRTVTETSWSADYRRPTGDPFAQGFDLHADSRALVAHARAQIARSRLLAVEVDAALARHRAAIAAGVPAPEVSEEGTAPPSAHSVRKR